MTEAENIKKYFTSTRSEILKVHAIERISGVPHTTLKFFLDGRRGLPKHHEEAIVRTLSIFGYEPVESDHQFL